MSTESVGKRFESVLRTIMDSRGLSQKLLGEKYLDVSQSCIRDYLSGKVHPLSVKVGTMQSIAALYGVSVDALMHYLMEGRWKQGLSYRDIDEAVRSMSDVKLLCNLMALTSDQIRSRLDTLSIDTEEPVAVVNPNRLLVQAIESEEQRISSPTQWQALLKAFDIGEGEIISLYNGQKPAFDFMVRVAKLLRMDVDQVQDMVGIRPLDESEQGIDSPIDVAETTRLSNLELNGDGIPHVA